jgi:mRNA-degrading endonuclease RelE of RelBE toxin-antitoxin system
MYAARAHPRRSTAPRQDGPEDARGADQRLEAIAEQPFAKHANVERIKGEQDAFRLRQGDWRAKYRVDRVAGEMRVLVIEPRGRVYR